MIKLTARIQLFGSGTNKYNYVSINNGKNNISSSIENVLNTRIRSGNAFILGSSKLDRGATFSSSKIVDGVTLSGVDYYIGNVLSSKSEPYQFQSRYTITFRPTYDNITIVFDDVGNGYPPTITTYPTATYTTDDAIVTISGLDTSRNDYRIWIDYWSKPNAPLIIRGIYTDVSIDLDYNNLISMSGSIFERSDYKLPNFGVISNSGNIEFNDIDGEILDYAEEGWLTGGLETKLKLTNTLVKNAQTNVGTYYTATWNYDTDNRTVSVSIKDDLEEWQDINVEGFNYDPRKPNKVLPNKTMGELYTWLWGKTPSKYKMQTLEELDEVTRTKLNSTYIEYPLLKSGNLWQQWSKFCEANQTHIYKNFDGITVCKYNGGN
jgi:hypothetical protein